ncbi:PREDICTED: alpha-(1,3)-fucosyltransferase C-like [Bactrocera latifrons]|nr:PREDICTED: alpha-(1,3)-fucosyltransferase C-like [Bactrocera latifrons]XP_018802445.1 PREDICTED: alpha-(1,3)-fucosyltransferase C-like [Bactrocera latifrons]
MSFSTSKQMYSNTRCLKLALRATICIIFLLTLIILVIFTRNNARNTALRMSRQPAPQGSVILFWNGFFQDKRWTLPADTFHAQCPRANCIFTNQHDFLPSIVDYAAIVFHTARKFTLFYGTPPQRAPNQTYVFAQLESPTHTWHNFQAESNFYNLTLSYRLDSDVVWSYNVVRTIATRQIIAPALDPIWPAVEVAWTQNDADLLLLIEGKRKMVAWFASNCKVASRRERLVKALQTHVQVDVYGKCGTLRCERFNSSCDELLDKDYKFYLSFENSLCKDYVTEKFFNALQRHIVPVVYGGANYTRFAPPHSYIDAQDFKNASSLAEYLNYLSEHPYQYAKYFWWRRYYRVEANDGGLHMLPYCELCERIHSKPTVRRTQVYEDINAFWTDKVCTKKARIDF